MSWHRRVLVWFDDWFSSEAGVWQTLAITIAIVVVEHLFPNLDAHGFLLLYWLTVYSAVTQPALAHTGRESSERLEALEDRTLADQEWTVASLTAIATHLGVDLPPREAPCTSS